MMGHRELGILKAVLDDKHTNQQVRAAGPSTQREPPRP
jgi:hypothetical protein